VLEWVQEEATMQELTKLSRDHLNHLYKEHMLHGFLQMRWQEIERNVRNIGADSYDILLPETHVLATITNSDEHILGIVYGRYKESNDDLIGRGALVATDRRVILVNRKPFYINCNEIKYDVVSGVSYARVGFMGTVTLHTRMGDIHLRTFNQNCAKHFIQAMEGRIFSKGTCPETAHQ
jgi:hypothetical protein